MLPLQVPDIHTHSAGSSRPLIYYKINISLYQSPYYNEIFIIIPFAIFQTSDSAEIFSFNLIKVLL